MLSSPQSIQVVCDGAIQDATVAWHPEGRQWVVTVDSPAFGRAEGRAADAFDALCRVRELLEQSGWRVGVVGAQPDVWPSGMARDQGSGLVAYRMTSDGAAGLVETFEPAHPATAVTVAVQRAALERLETARRDRPSPD